MKKEIIGYKLIKHEYEKAAVQICKSKGASDTDNFKISSQGICFTNTSFCKVWLEEAGVLDLWFETVYEEIFKENEWLYKEEYGFKLLFRYNRGNKEVLKTKEYYHINEREEIIGEGACDNLTDLEDSTKATDSQIQEILTIVAKHKGFVEGVKFKTPVSEHTRNCTTSFTYSPTHDYLYCNNLALYSAGQWATIIKPTELVRSWEEAFIHGYVINAESAVVKVDWYKPTYDNKRLFKTLAQAKSALAFAQLSHIVADANGDWVAGYYDVKYTVCPDYNKNLQANIVNYGECFLSMKSPEIVHACIEKHRTLWEDFWMVSK